MHCMLAKGSVPTSFRKWDFDEAFCSHINSKYGKTYGGGWKADAQTQSVRRRK